MGLTPLGDGFPVSDHNNDVGKVDILHVAISPHSHQPLATDNIVLEV